MNFPTADAIETVNFSPKQELLLPALAMLREVFWEAPSDAILKLRFEKGSSGFVARLQVNAMQGNFSASAGSDSAVGLLASLQEQISSQLREWKKRRVFR